MQVNEIMTRNVDIIDPNTTVRDAARTMRADNIGALPVGENDRLIGMVTDRDIVCAGSPKTKWPETRRCARSCRNMSITVSRTMTWNRRPTPWLNTKYIAFRF